MTRTAALTPALVVCLLPGVADAAVTVFFDPEVVIAGELSSTVGIDVYLEGVGAEDDEQLIAYDIGFRLAATLPESQSTFSFVEPYAEKPADNFVFGDRPVSFEVLTGAPVPAGPAFFLLSVEALGADDLPDISSPVKIARVLIETTGSNPAALYYLHVDPALTSFGSGDPDRVFTEIEADTSDRVAIFLPEPSAAGLLLAGAAVALCRRRRR